MSQEQILSIEELESLFLKTTQGEWKTIGDSFKPPEWWLVSGPGIFGADQIAGPSEAMRENPDFEWIAAMHNAFPEILRRLKSVTQQPT